MKFNKLFVPVSVFSIVFINACKDDTTTPAVDCSKKNITVGLSKTDASKCLTDGTVTVSATGSEGFTYQLNSGSFQAAPTFTGLAAGTYTVTVKDVDGCTKSGSVTVNENTTKGAKFTAAYNIVNAKCQGSCHGQASTGAPTNIFNTECGVVLKGERIKIRAIDEGMGGLSQNEINTINAWLNAGGRYTD